MFRSERRLREREEAQARGISANLLESNADPLAATTDDTFEFERNLVEESKEPVNSLS